jgi:hypothetical protein
VAERPGVSGDGEAAQLGLPFYFLPCDLHWVCDGRHRRQTAISFTTKAAPISSIDQAGGLRSAELVTPHMSKPDWSQRSQ